MFARPSLETRVMWYATVGASMAVLAAGAIAGHILRLAYLSDLGGNTSMALNTALSLLLCGAAWITHAADLRTESDSHG